MPRSPKKLLRHGKKSCFGYEGGCCVVLTSDDCEGCRFFKTRQQVNRERKETEKKYGSAPCLPNLGL